MQKSFELRDVLKSSLELDARVRRASDGWSLQQLNWRPDRQTWSVGQQFHHLVLGNRLYVEIVERLALDAKPETTGYRPGFWGRVMLKAVGPDDKLPAPVPKQMVPSENPIETSVITEYFELQERFHRAASSLEGKDLDQKFRSPFASFVNLKLGDAIQIVERHNARHLGKVLAMIEASDFPR